MKTIKQFSIAAMLSVLMISGAFAQDQKKFSIYLNMKKNGKSVIIDTTFNSRKDMEAFMKQNGIEVAEMPELPPLPPLPPLSAPPNAPEAPTPPDAQQIIINIDDSEISDEQKAEIKIEMDKAFMEMENTKGEMKDVEKALKEADKELKNMKIEISDDAEDGNRSMIIRKVIIDDENNSTNSDMDGSTDKKERTQKIIKITSGDNQGESKSVKVICIPDETKTDAIKNKADSPSQQIELKSESASKIAESSDNKLKISEFKIYPNPTEGRITVSFKTESDGDVEVRILDGTGKEIVNEKVNVQNGIFSKEYNIEGKARGTYLLQLRQGNQWRHEKIVIK